MKPIKQLIQSDFKTLSAIFIAMVFSVFTLMLRMKLNKSFFYLFLVWNAFLALIPYAITMYLKTVRLKKWQLGLSFAVWLLFLPNAPYIITDFLHLRVSNTSFLWLDILVLLSFALSGLLLFYLSLNDMKAIVNEHFPKISQSLFIATLLLLSSFGVFLGRFIRFNSWDVLSQPQLITNTVWDIITKPQLHSEAWLFTLAFGGFLYIGLFIINKFNKSLN
ncbi:DUF1361 domain-containing protein [Winogradskyella maritima]|uniref:DUF1361 domain-containing protein n=1 Tax=Winogradskyella maritima TaxID=1517766 RepID=A0ABV8AJZ4_9FLAO|nr:DUF1361 domain-containing protein [Winogradskyella maritima]